MTPHEHGEVAVAPAGTTSRGDSDCIKDVGRMRRLSAMLDEDLEDVNADEIFPDTSSALAASHAPEQRGETAEYDDAQQSGTDFKCIECKAHEAEVFCEQCVDYFCELCYGGQHRKGNRKQHTSQPWLRPGSIKTGAADADDDVDVDMSMPQKLQEDNEDDLEGDTSSDDSDAPSASARRPNARNICNLMGHFFLGGAYPYSNSTTRLKNNSGSAAQLSEAAAAKMVDRAKYIPVRLTYEERKLLRIVEAALCVSNYTDKLDNAAYLAPAKRIRAQLQDICGFLTGLVVGYDYKAGQAVLDEKNFSDHAGFFQEIFELGRRYKIMNPEKMRGEYGKLMYFLQDAVSPEIQELLGFSCVQKIRTVYDVLEEGQATDVLRHPKIELATMVVAPEGKSRAQIQRQIKQKELAIREISEKYTNHQINRDTIQQCLYSIADNNYHLYFERDPIDRMIQLLTESFHPQLEEEGYSLAIVSGNDGSRLSHSHNRQYNYVLQSLTLWREIAHDMFRLWCLTDEDLLADDSKYTLAETGQGLHRIQPAPRVSRAMHVLLHTTQRNLESWVGSSVIHLGDKNVPNALMFIDKYTQVGHILRPIVKTVDSIEKLCADSPELKKYIDQTFGGAKKLKRDILSDFFREAFDGSGADNFFEAGSCIDGRLTSAWNWCSNLDKKEFFPVFKLAGFVGFDGKFG